MLKGINTGQNKGKRNSYAKRAIVSVDGRIVEEVDNYINLGKKLRDGELLPQFKRRITLGWATFEKFKDILKSTKAPMRVKAKIFNEYILPAMLYSFQTLALTSSHEEKLAVAQRKTKRIMLNI